MEADATLQFNMTLDIATIIFVLASKYIQNTFFLCPPSFGIASCIGTIGTVCDTYTWYGPAM